MSNLGYLADRWLPDVQGGSGGGVSQVQVLDSPNVQSVYAYSLTQVDGDYVGGTAYAVQQRYEVRDARRMANRQLTLNFWYKTNRSGQHNARFAICDGLITNVLADALVQFSVEAVGSWQYCVVNFGFISPNSSWTAAETSLGASMEIGFLCGSGSGGTSTVSNGQYFELAQVRLIAGRLAPTMPAPDPVTELLRCQRYFEKTYSMPTPPGAANSQNSALVFSGGSSSYGAACWQFQTRKRTGPQVTFYSPVSGAANNLFQSDLGASTSEDVSTITTAVSDSQCSVEAQTATVRSSRAYLYAHATADAEL